MTRARLMPTGLRIRGQDGFGGLGRGARRQGAALVGQQPADDRHHLGRRLALAENHFRHPGARRAAVIQDGEVRRLAGLSRPLRHRLSDGQPAFLHGGQQLRQSICVNLRHLRFIGGQRQVHAAGAETGQVERHIGEADLPQRGDDFLAMLDRTHEFGRLHFQPGDRPVMAYAHLAQPQPVQVLLGASTCDNASAVMGVP